MAFLDTIQKWSAAIAFAEAGEFDTARQIAGIKGSPAESPSTLFERIEKMSVAVAFAEEGLFKEASDLLGPAQVREPEESRPSFLEIVGLQHVPARMYVMTA